MKTIVCFLARVAMAIVLACVLGLPRVLMAQGRAPSDVILLGPEGIFVRAIDGDTFEVDLSGQRARVRLIGVDAPALGACFGAIARNALTNLLIGRTVILERDTSDTEHSGALLRYAYLRDGRMVNEELVRGGHARAVNALPDTKHQADLNALEAAARRAGLGGWGACGWKSSVVRAAGQCVMIEAADLMMRGTRPPILNTMKQGDCVRIVKPLNDVSEAWSGHYVFHPAGSTVKLNQGYARWKDGFVLLTRDPNDAGVMLASVDEDRRSPFPLFKLTHFGALLPLERDPGNDKVVRLPVIKSWLFLDLGNGNFRALTDYFEYKAGDLRWPRLADNGQLY